jgi:hypothetical protein
VEQLTDLRRAIVEFSKSYVRLHPEQESTSGGEGLRLTGFADYAWTGSWERDSNGHVQFSTNAWLGRVYGYWQTLIAGMDVAQLTRSFEAANTLIQGATRTVLLHRDGYQNVRAIHEGGLLRELIELGFELTRTGVVNPAGTVQTSAEWLEAVLEGNVRLVAGGLGQYVQGFEGNYGSPGYAYTNAYRDGLDYLQRLMRAAAAIDDPSLQPQMRDAKFLSHLVNLGGAYLAAQPKYTPMVEGGESSFLVTLMPFQQVSDGLLATKIHLAAEQLESILNQFSSTEQIYDAIRYETSLLRVIGRLSDGQLSDMPEIPASLISYVREEEDSGLGNSWAFLQPSTSDIIVASLSSSNLVSVIKADPWNPPGQQPPNFYIGNVAHQKIARYYGAVNKNDRVYTNFISIGAIVYEHGGDNRRITDQEARLKPDIANITKQHLYEIKPHTQNKLAAQTVGRYRQILNRGGIQIDFGPINAPGTGGVVPAPGGHYVFATSQRGVILYRYFKGDYRPPVTEPATGLEGYELLIFLILSIFVGSQLGGPKNNPIPRPGY